MSAGEGPRPAPPSGEQHHAERRTPVFWITAAAGWIVIAFGVRGALVHHVDTRPRELARDVVGIALVHDLLVAPLVVAVGLGLARLVPGRARAPIQAAAIVSAALVVVTYPLVRGFGHRLNNPSSLPHDYAANLALVLAIVWTVAGVGAVARIRAGRSARRAAPSPDRGPVAER